MRVVIYMGNVRVKVRFHFMSGSFGGLDPRSEPFLDDPGYRQNQTHIRSSRLGDCTIIPLSAGWLRRTRPLLTTAF
jgi:hypothetical protein